MEIVRISRILAASTLPPTRERSWPPSGRTDASWEGRLLEEVNRTYRRATWSSEFDPKRKFGLIDSFKLRQYNLFRRVFERQAVKQRRRCGTDH